MLLLAIVIIPLVYDKYNDREQVIIPNDAIRIRVIANSNSLDDQYEKLKVRENVQLLLEKVLKNVKTKQETERIIKSNLFALDQNVKKTLKEAKSNTTYDLHYGSNYFPKKEFKGVTYDEGYYDSLVITLGKGQGDNWWCVLFPPLCLLEAEEENIDDIEYGLFVEKVISDYK